VDFSGQWDYWWGVHEVTETEDWQNFLNPLSSSMGYDYATSNLMAEEIIPFTAPTNHEVDSVFMEIDVTDQVHWMLAHTGEDKGTFSGQYAIVLLVPPNEGNTGKVYTYSDESCSGNIPMENNPWTRDGNTVHIVVNGDLEPVSIENPPEMAAECPVIGQNYPNPFNPVTRIPYNLGPGQYGELKIFDVRGKKVFDKAVTGSGAVIWNAANHSSGIYVVRVRVGGNTYLKRVSLIK
jgi:hypothetical protein